MGHLVSSSTSAFLTNMSDKRKSRSPTIIQVINQQKTISTAEKLDVISKFENGEEIVDIWCNVRLAHSTVYTICENADRIKESAKCLGNIKCQSSETGMFV
jgi:hypothetical protein